MPEFSIGNRVVRPGDVPFVIAEAGVNHEGDLKTAERMIEAAAAAGADAIKFQTYKAEKIAAADSPTYWNESKTQREYFKAYDMFDAEEYRHLAKVCQQNGIMFLSTPFDAEAVEFLEPLMPAYKVASADITNVLLLRQIARTGKPVILSTGASTLSEIAYAVDFLQEHGAGDIALLHCVLSYPTEYHLANLRSIQYLQSVFPDLVIGYSDHTKPDPGMALVTTAAILGASIIEKHFTLDKSLPGNDHYHAMDPADLRLLVNNLKIAFSSLGEAERPVFSAEQPARTFARRSLVTARAIPKGTTITEDCLTAKRPGTGISPIHLDMVIGRKAARDLDEDTILQWNMLD